MTGIVLSAVLYSAHIMAEGRSYTVFLAFQPEAPPPAEVMWAEQKFPESVEFQMGAYAGKTRCTASAQFKIGTASMRIIDDATKASRSSWKETAPAVLIVESEELRKDDGTRGPGCGIPPGPLPNSSFFYVEGPLTVSIPDPKGGEPILSIEAQVVKRTVLERQTASTAKAGERLLRLDGFDASKAPDDFGALVTRRRGREEVADFRRLP